MVVYYILDADGYPDTASLDPIEGAQVGTVSEVTEHANNYHRRGKPARFQREDPSGLEHGNPGPKHDVKPKARKP